MIGRQMPQPHDVTFFASPAQLRAWFEANHETATELWLGYHLKKTGRPSVTWQDAVDQELCFGWIDSVRYSLGDGKTAQRLTPRRKGSVWSAINIRRFRELDALGLVHPNGRAAFERRDEARSAIYSYENRSRGFDAATEAEFRRHKRAWKFFEAQAPSYRMTAAFLVMSAKQEETRKRRLAKLIEHSQNGERLPQLVSPSRRRRPAP
jgi:uncharacterized protein YdeI (YjbR/CyaY-like superfamily)